MTDDQLNAKLARIAALMNNVTPGTPEEAEYLALVAEVQAEEDRRGLEELKCELSTWKNATTRLMAEAEEIDRLLLGTFGKSREERIQTLLEWQRVGRAATGAAGLRDAADLEGWCRDRKTAMEQIPMFGKRAV